MIKTIFSDLGNVLIYVSNASAGLMIHKHGFFKRKMIRYKINKYERGEMGTEEFYTWYGKTTGQEIDLKRLDERFDKIFRLNNQMADLLTKLKPDYRLITLSNTNESNHDFIMRKYDVMKIFDDYVLSYKVGALKPDKRIYQAALEKAKCKPEECLFIDDIEKFVKGARKSGMKAVHYKSHSFLEEELRQVGIL